MRSDGASELTTPSDLNLQEQKVQRHDPAAENPLKIASLPETSETKGLTMTPNRTTIEHLPNELLTNIFTNLDSLNPSSFLLHEEPTFDITQSEFADLKSISLVSKRLRRAILPLLFKHAQYISKGSRGQYTVLDQEIRPLLDFLTQNQLNRVLTTFTLIVYDKKVSANGAEGRLLNTLSGFWELLFGAIDPVELLLVAPAEALGTLTSCYPYLEDFWCLDCPCQYLKLWRPPSTDPAGTRVVHPASRSETSLNSDVSQTIRSATSQFVLNELASSSTTSPEPQVNQTAAGSVSSSPASRTRTLSYADKTLNRSALFEALPWNKLLLNEGSFVKAYSTYEFFLKRPPSILPDLLGDDTPRRDAVISPTVKDMEYIGVFPMTSHFSSLTMHLPRLDRLYVQIVPRNDILQDTRKMAQVEANDLWSERNHCYAILMRELFNSPAMGNYQHLKIFESGDAADQDAWNMAVEFVRRTSTKWKVAEEGVFVRDPDDGSDESGVDDGEPTSLLVNP